MEIELQNQGTIIGAVSHKQHLEHFVAHMGAGDQLAALRAASEACHAAPSLREPHYAYGQAWLALGHPGRAEEAFGAALRIDPHWAEAWINYGLCRYRRNAIEDAKTAMRQALLFAPGHPAAIANLGAFMRITGQSEAAEVLLRQAIDQAPDNVGARLNLAADLLQEERPSDTLALLDAAPALPTDPRALLHWQLQRSLALLQLHRPTEARPILAALGAVPSAIRPLVLWRHVLLALDEGDVVRARTAAAEMRSALDKIGPDAVPEHRIMGHYDLAKFWSGQNEHSIAFGHWIEGHALLKPFEPFSRDEHKAFIDASIAAFPASGFHDVATNHDPAPVFIVGMPRSGTTLCEQIIGAHAQAHGAGERSSLSNVAQRLGTPEQIAALPTGVLNAEAERYLAELHALAPQAGRIVDKMPANYLHLGLVGRLLPGAKIIHCVRDPRDIGLSIFTFRFHGAHGYAHDLADLGWTIAQQARVMAHWKAVLPHQILTVNLSDWVTDFDGTLRRVLTLLDLPYDVNCARFYEADSRVRTVSRTQVRQPVNARGLGRWLRYETELKPLIEELELGGALEDSGGAASHRT
jgi:Tfp pilus assembly protein PilF